MENDIFPTVLHLFLCFSWLRHESYVTPWDPINAQPNNSYQRSFYINFTLGKAWMLNDQNHRYTINQNSASPHVVLT